MIIHAFIAEFRRGIVEFKRYPTEFVSQIFLVVVIFYGLFLGGKYITGGEVFGDRLSGVVIGYVMWVLVLDAIGSMGYTISEESKNGNLEQVFLSPLGATVVLFVRNVANLFYLMFFISVVLVLIMTLTGHYLDLSIMNLVPLIMAVGVAIGIGYLVASITIIFKRTDQFLNMIQFALLFVIMTPFTDFENNLAWLSIIIPFSPMIGLLKEMIINGHSIFEVSHLFIWSGINLFIWLGLGMFFFKLADKKARRMGSLGHY